MHHQLCHFRALIVPPWFLPSCSKGISRWGYLPPPTFGGKSIVIHYICYLLWDASFDLDFLNEVVKNIFIWHQKGIMSPSPLPWLLCLWAIVSCAQHGSPMHHQSFAILEPSYHLPDFYLIWNCIIDFDPSAFGGKSAVIHCICYLLWDASFDLDYLNEVVKRSSFDPERHYASFSSSLIVYLSHYYIMWSAWIPKIPPDLTC